jgi:hypothetical protein
MPLTQSEAKQLYDLSDEISETIESLLPISRAYKKLVTSIRESNGHSRVGPGRLSFWIPLADSVLDGITGGSRVGGLLITSEFFGIIIFSKPPEHGGVLIDQFTPVGFGGFYQKRAVRRYLQKWRSWLATRATG